MLAYVKWFFSTVLTLTLATIPLSFTYFFALATYYVFQVNERILYRMILAAISLALIQGSYLTFHELFITTGKIQNIWRNAPWHHTRQQCVCQPNIQGEQVTHTISQWLPKVTGFVAFTGILIAALCTYFQAIPHFFKSNDPWYESIILLVILTYFEYVVCRFYWYCFWEKRILRDIWEKAPWKKAN